MTASCGESMLDLTEEEQRALQIVSLVTSVKAERYGAAHQLNWKKVGLSRAYFRKERLQESRMPTARCAAAFRFLQANNEYYKSFLREHNARLDAQAVLTVSPFDLFINMAGVECAMYPHLYPLTRFTDTGILQHHRAETEEPVEVCIKYVAVRADIVSCGHNLAVYVVSSIIS